MNQQISKWKDMDGNVTHVIREKVDGIRVVTTGTGASEDLKAIHDLQKHKSVAAHIAAQAKH